MPEAADGNWDTLNSEVSKLLYDLSVDNEETRDLSAPNISPKNEKLSLEEKAQLYDEQVAAADAVSSLLLDSTSQDPDEEEKALIATLGLEKEFLSPRPKQVSIFDFLIRGFSNFPKDDQENIRRISWIIVLSVIVLIAAVAVIGYGEMTEVTMPPMQPIGAYKVVEAQEGDSFFNYYNVYNGPDSKGSNGFNYYRNLQFARETGLVKILKEKSLTGPSRRTENLSECENCTDAEDESNEEKFVYIGSRQTEEGPLDSVRLEGKRRFNRGLFILDLRHIANRMRDLAGVLAHRRKQLALEWRD